MSLIGASLPPLVEGQLRCFLSVKVGELVWSIPSPPKDVQTQLIWWGEKGEGVFLRPEVVNDPNYVASKQKTEANFPVRCGPNQISSYLEDMVSLHFELLYGPSCVKFAKVDVPHIGNLSPNKSLQGYHPVVCTTADFKHKEVGKLFVLLSFKSISDVHNDSAPEVKLTNQTSMPNVTSKKKKTKKKVQTKKNLNNQKHVKIADSPDRIIYNVLSPISKDDKDISFVVGPGHTNIKEGISLTIGGDDDFDLILDTKEDDLKTKVDKPSKYGQLELENELHYPVQEDILEKEKQHNILSTLLLKGQQLRDAMLKSGVQSYRSRKETGSGDLIKELLRDEGHLTHEEIETIDISEKGLRVNENKNIEARAVEIVLGEGEESKIENLLRKLNISDDDNDELSDENDPLRDSSLLSDLFYTTKINKKIDESSILFSDDEDVKIIKSASIENLKAPKKCNEQTEGNEKESQESLQEDDNINHVFETSDEISQQYSVDNTGSSVQDSYKKLLLEQISIEQLTTLGRIKSVKFTLHELNLHKVNAVSYFTELKFPVSTNASSNEPALEIVRLVCRNISGEKVNFDRISIFPIYFDEKMVEYWWNNHVVLTLMAKFSQQRKPMVIGEGHIILRKVIMDEMFSTTFSLPIFPVGQAHKPSRTVGKCWVTVELLQDSTKNLNVATNRASNIPSTKVKTTKLTPNVLSTRETKSINNRTNEEAKIQVKVETVRPQKIYPTEKDKLSKLEKKGEANMESDGSSKTLYNIILVEEGRDILTSSMNDSQTGNIYLACRVFWATEEMKSKICWNSSNPVFEYQKVTPVSMATQSINKMRNNLMIIEVWNKSTTVDRDKLIGMCKLSLHHYYMSFKDPVLAETILKSKFPVISRDDWIPVINLFTGDRHGSLKIIFALGSYDQVMELLHMHNMKKNTISRSRDGQRTVEDKLNIGPNQMYHQIEITLERVNGMLHGNQEVWGETDCYIQYYFPEQKRDDIKLSCFQSKTTLCTPNPVFNHSTNHTFTMDNHSPLQGILLQGFNSSSSPGEVIFELWKRHYYPNVRDQMIAKAGLPFAKLCAMITLHGQNNLSTQTFHLPLNSVILTEEAQACSALNLLVKYQVDRDMDVTYEQPRNLVCLSVSVLKLCGLKTAASKLSQYNSKLTYYADVGLNVYVKFFLSFLGDTSFRSTRIAAKCFAPAFSYHTDFPLPVRKENHPNQEVSLAELMENGFLTCHVFHAYSEKGLDDVLLGETNIPLRNILSHTTGLKGWWSLNLPSKYQKMKQCAGGIEIEVKFPQNTDRELVVNTGRGCGWRPAIDVQCCDEEWLSPADVKDGGACFIRILVHQLLLPDNVFKSIFTHSNEMQIPYTKVYARYKFYNKAAICSQYFAIKQHKDRDYVIKLSNVKSYEVSPTTSFAWYLREEKLEVQFWLSCATEWTRRAQPQSCDKHLGSVYVDMSSFSTSPFNVHSVSGEYNLFKPGAENICDCSARISISFNEKYTEVDTKTNGSLDSSSEDATLLNESNLLNDICTQTSGNKITQNDGLQEVTESDDGKLSIRFQIEEALHLPTYLKESESMEPDVYVSYELEKKGLVFTDIYHKSAKPRFNFQKLEKVHREVFDDKYLDFKVWRCVSNIQNAEKDILIGVAKVDVSALFYGMKQIIGWYNIHDFNGQTAGQLKVGVIPAVAISPSRSAKFFKQFEFMQPVNLDMAFFSKCQDATNSLSVGGIPETSKSMLFEQLKHNLQDLSDLTSNIRKRVDSEWGVMAVESKPHPHTSSGSADITVNEKTDEEGCKTVDQSLPVAVKNLGRDLSRHDSVVSDNESFVEFKKGQDGGKVNNFEDSEKIKAEGSAEDSEFSFIDVVETGERIEEEKSHSTDELMEHLREFERKYEHLKQIVLSDDDCDHNDDDDDDNDNDDDYNDREVKKSNSDNIFHAHNIDRLHEEIDEVINVSSKETSNEDIKTTDSPTEVLTNNHYDQYLETKNEPVSTCGKNVQDGMKGMDIGATNLNHQDDLATLPNFFMRPQEMAASIKALRIAANFRGSPRVGSVSENKSDYKSSDEENPMRRKLEHNIDKSFKERIRTKLPVEASEMARISSIFLSKPS
ncbi:C2 domain-containing protein 3-like isoform X2 [Hydractinia symbiolongicarpus]|uniref:C2 domain-containing protein 3-like isoform X2 n=1 Tax=Hydractinia symbiolongicarpus TaxID=13093 RepID=UPI0025510DFA|nr:C2 domain-containing protein 3-like isoform X2 [Hydractinia symbiolongicarpus]